MPQTPSRVCRGFAARLATRDHFRAHGLASELTDHVLFASHGLCTCTRCQFQRGEAHS